MEDSDGAPHYIDFDTVKERNGYVYWWKKSIDNDNEVVQEYVQGDCELTRVKLLQMVLSDGVSLSLPFGDDWTYLPPNSIGEAYLVISCHLIALTPEEKQRYIEELMSFIEPIAETKEEDSESKQLLEDILNELKEDYIGSIALKIRKEWRYLGAEDHWSCDVYIIQSEVGDVLAVNIQNCTIDDSSKAKSFKDSIERAVYRASPLPIALDHDLFDAEIMFHFRVN